MFRFDREKLRVRPDSAFAEQRRVQFQDVDAAGIVFYPRVLIYCHDLLVSFFAHAGEPLPDVLRTRSWVAPIRHAEADYFRPLRFGDRIEVALVQAHVQETEVVLGFRVAQVDEDEVCAVAQSVHAFLEPDTFKRRPIPEGLRGAFQQMAEPRR